MRPLSPSCSDTPWSHHVVCILCFFFFFPSPFSQRKWWWLFSFVGSIYEYLSNCWVQAAFFKGNEITETGSECITNRRIGFVPWDGFSGWTSCCCCKELARRRLRITLLQGGLKDASVAQVAASRVSEATPHAPHPIPSTHTHTYRWECLTLTDRP